MIFQYNFREKYIIDKYLICLICINNFNMLHLNLQKYIYDYITRS